MRKTGGEFLVIIILCLFLASCATLDDSSGLNGGISNNAANGSNNTSQSDKQANIVNNNMISEAMDKGPVKGGTLKLFSTEPDTLNPVFTKNRYAQDFLGFVYEGLTKLNERQEAVPLLSDRWTVSADGLIWNFHIRAGVKWHDGTPLTSEDVEFTVNSILNTRNNSQYKTLLQNVVTFAAVDTENFKFVLNRPNSFMAEQMCFPIIPRHQFKGTIASNEGLTGFKPVGTGPYSFIRYEKGKDIILEAYRDWWCLGTAEEPEHLLYIDNIDIKLYKSSRDAINSFQTNDIDVSGIDVSDIGKYYGRTDIMIKKFDSREYEFLAFNFEGKITNDLSVRTAINMSIDRKSIIDGILGGCAVEADIPVNPQCWLYEDLESDRTLKGTPQTASEIKPGAILEAGGWKKNEQYYYKVINGIRNELALEIITIDSNPQRIKIAERICEQLKSNGISAAVVKLDWDQFMQRIDTKKYDIALMGLRTGRTPDISYLYSSSLITPYKALNGVTARNISGYSNSEVDNYLHMILLESDKDLKMTYFRSMKQILDKELPYIGLCFLNEAVIYRKSIRGLYQPNCWDMYNDITQWYMLG